MNRNVWLLSLCQALLMTGNILLISVIALIGKTLAPSPSFITLPVALQFLGLMLAVYSQQWSDDGLYTSAFSVLIVLYITALVLLQTIRFPPAHTQLSHVKVDTISDIIRRPNFMIAVLAAMVAYAVMNILMTATPLAMIGCGFDFDKAAGVIEWHVLGMFAPAFITGRLIEQFGAKKMILAGGVLFIACIGINIHGVSIWHFSLALVLLGVGWNFMFIAATGLFSQSYEAKNRSKAQAFNEFFVFSCVTITALLSGWLESTVGWQNLNLYVLPFVLLVIVIFAMKTDNKTESQIA